MTRLLIADDATRDEIATAIAEVKRRHDRLPKHFEAKRAELMDEIDCLVSDWLAAPQ